ncbi:septation ring formation regulator EzrA [Barrientosiimonas marina]|uniref:Septation ring formation regulator EzrA n=1 Tax=Lentibacillus kimchii TaxID=1542911 RepID=A0ABW2USZ0_9BACI
MAYLIGGVLVLVAIIITGLIMRKRIYDDVDRLESWKMTIMNRNIAGELSRIKNLNLSGETQEKFEAWKEQWEHIVANDLPDIEEYLFDAEAAADHYRFPSAKKVLRQADQELQTIEQKIEDMLSDLDNLMNSEESSRHEIEKIQPRLKAMRKTLSQNRIQFGKADESFEKAIDELEEKLNKYHELTADGDYLEARELVENLKEQVDALSGEMDAFPAVYRKCKYELPKELDELHRGFKQMENDGYRVRHLGFEKEIHHYKRQLEACMEELETGDTSQANAVISEVEERLADMYQLLEKEAIAKNYVDTNFPSFEESLGAFEHTFAMTKEEVTQLQQSYYFEDSDMEKYLSLDKSITQLRNHLEEMTHKLNDDETAHSDLRDDLEYGFNDLETLQQKHDAFKKRIDNLREDEMEAKESLEAKREQLYEVKRRLTKSNVPGVPSYIWNKMDEAVQKNNQVFSTLEKQPLDMTEVQDALSKAKTAVDDVAEQTETMLDQAHLTEQVIQYANRYRSQNPELAAKLSEAERLFRSYEYEMSLEHAAKAVEQIEPGALKHIEEFQKTAN